VSARYSSHALAATLGDGAENRNARSGSRPPRRSRTSATSLPPHWSTPTFKAGHT